MPKRSDLLNSLKKKRKKEKEDLLLDKFHKLLHEEYLLSLREQSHVLYQIDFKNIIKIDDLVLIKNLAKAKPYWSLGRVVNVIPGNDYCIRSTNVKKPNDNIQLHSIKHLYPLELSIPHFHQTNTPPEVNTQYENNLNTDTVIASPSESHPNPTP